MTARYNSTWHHSTQHNRGGGGDLGAGVTSCVVIPQLLKVTAQLLRTPLPPPGSLSPLQVLMLPNFHDFPSDAITVEFWMQSTDTCRPGVPFSYAHGRYEKEDNSFLIFNYNSL